MKKSCNLIELIQIVFADRLRVFTKIWKEYTWNQRKTVVVNRITITGKKNWIFIISIKSKTTYSLLPSMLVKAIPCKLYMCAKLMTLR